MREVTHTHTHRHTLKHALTLANTATICSLDIIIKEQVAQRRNVLAVDLNNYQ